MVELDSGSESDEEAVNAVSQALAIRWPTKLTTSAYLRPFSSKAPALCVYVAALYPPKDEIIKDSGIPSSRPAYVLIQSSCSNCFNIRGGVQGLGESKERP